MADIVVPRDGPLSRAVSFRYKDMGDGTYALVRAALISGVNCDGGGGIVVPCVDEYTGGFVVVSHYEADVHLSKRFKSSYLQPHGSELADDAVHDFLIRTGVLGAHATIRISVGGDCDLLLYEATTVSNNGNALDTISKNREVIGTAQTLTYEGPTVTGVGTLLFSWFVPGGARGGGGGLGGGDWGETPWILAPSTNYMIRITNRSGAAIQLSVSSGWSEY